ncbi:RidA family protein [Streptomyces sp. NBC_01591]|uniref:RidA family protein n=1 Tax=Streptomyces sp. NBC_01591 TaxID=2975888 RepID=UPI002DD8E250|nr:Rid family hydrolase [Streptomyces sp. NBC_01591]
MEHFIHPNGSLPVNGCSHAVAFTGGMVAGSGQVPVDDDGNPVGKEDAEAQVRQVYANLTIALVASPQMSRRRDRCNDGRRPRSGRRARASAFHRWSALGGGFLGLAPRPVLLPHVRPRAHAPLPGPSNACAYTEALFLGPPEGVSLRSEGVSRLCDHPGGVLLERSLWASARS